MKDYKNLSFGSLKEPKVEEIDKFNGKAMLIIHEAPTERGKAWRMSLNKAAQEAFEVTRNEEYPITALFAKDENNNVDVFLVNATSVAFDEKVMYLLRKNKSISSKVLYKEVQELFSITDTSKENYLELTVTEEVTTFLNNRITEEEGEGTVIKTLQIKSYTPEPQTEEIVSEASEESIEA